VFDRADIVRDDRLIRDFEDCFRIADDSESDGGRLSVSATVFPRK